MKRIINILLLLQCCFIAAAQPPYPTAPPAPGNITGVEYFIRPFGGTDPGFGNGTSLAVTPQQNINGYSEAINLGALPQGYYRIMVRSMDADGKWSLTNTGTTFSYVITPVYPVAPPAVTNIVRLEYAIDANVPFGSGVPISITPATNIASLNVVIDISSIAAGPHILYIRGMDADGKWGITNISFFSNAPAPLYPAAPPAAGPLQQLEYFIDTDPGFGLATPVSFTAGADVTVSFPVNGIAAGNHFFCIRSRNNPWSLTNIVPFSVDVATPVTWLYLNGEINNGQSHINWATASEQNSKEFIVEHSTDGRQFMPFTTVAAAGNSNTARRYTAVHPLPVRGMNYYRIKQVDADGRYKYTAVLPLLNTTAGGLLLSPNPAGAYTVLLLNQPALQTHIALYNSGGQLVMRQTVSSGMRQHTINTGTLPAGRYMLEVNENGQRQSLALLKQ